MKYVLIVDYLAVAQFYDVADEKSQREFSKLFDETIGMNQISRNDILRKYLNDFYKKREK